ncbi:GTPase-activating protein CdGAPr isoform X3 [Palaemon carinicauda]|uniref:GTPase-activating protein CdGAPr isoform X3 n=1 Tax=Palaemon carinicauda TaxID=392227 RepID=UPI0035B5A5BB
MSSGAPSSSSSPQLSRSSSPSVGSIQDDPTRSRDYAPDDAARVTPVKRRRLLPLVDLRGGGMAGSSVELGGRGMGGVGGLGGSLGPGRRSRTPLTDLAKSGLCVSSDVGDGGGVRITHLTGSSGMGVNVGGSMVDMDEGETRFPRLDQCAHFHYEYVELPPLQISLVHEELKPLSAGTGYACEDTENRSHLVQVASLGRSWVLRRTYDNFRFLDRQLHRCCYDRKFSHLPELPPEENLPGNDREAAVAGLLGEYVARLSEVAGSLITCGPVLNWLELDNRGHRLIVTDDSDINTPAVAAAYVVKRYIAQASDEISFEVGDMISVIDMPPPEESIWWRGKRGFQVGFFPCECVQVIGDKVPQTIQPQTLTLPPARTQPAIAAGHQHHTLHSGAQAPMKPVLRKHGKLIAFFRSFILSRPSRRKLKQSGILRERVFGCDLGEHLLNSGHEIPMVLRCCSEFLEGHGVVDGIYRLSGITSNIQKLRNAFDEDRIPDLYGDENILQDIHCVSSVLKMYFRELPNPLLTYQLYEKFVAAVMQDEDVRLLYLRDVVQQLPPPHYRTLEYLVQHLARIASHSCDTGMTPKNIAIVWAPNLLRSKDLDNGGVAALQDVGTQAVVTEYLVRYVDLIFNDKIPTFYHSTNGVEGTPKKSRPKSLAISTPTKLLSIEEARTRALNPAIKPDQKYIEVGGGPQNLPPKYHTVIELPNRKGGSLKQKKSPSGWKSIFSKGRSIHKHQRKASTPSDIHLNISALDSPGRLDTSDWESPERVNRDERESRSSSLSSPIPSPRTHNRSVSHDSYFNTLENQTNNLPSQVPVKEEGESDIDFSPSHSRMNLDISELDLNFSTSEKDLKGFEVDTLKSTSVEDPDDMSGSTLDMENLSMCSDSAKSKENLSPRPEKKSLKEKIRHRFTSPPTQRRVDHGISDSSEDSCNNSLKRASASLKDKIVYALSPETTRRRSDASPKAASPSSSPKLKHVRTTDGSNKGNQAKHETSGYLSTSKMSEMDNNVETVLAEVHVEPGSRESGDTSSRQSMDSALIDPELLDKITHLRTSPSISASEVSNTSIADISPSDNECISLGTLGKCYSGLVIATQVKETGSDSSSSNILSSATVVAPGTPPVTIIAEGSEVKEETQVTPMDEDLTPLQEIPKARPNSLLGLPTAELLTLGSALTSPETPQGDSTFLEIQYHPLSDTTEPSTPSESQFVQDLVAGGHSVPNPPVVDEPRQSSPLSVDLSSSDEPTEDGPMYENVDISSSVHSGQNSINPYDEPEPLSPTTSIQSSLASFQTSQTSGQGLLESEVVGSDVDYENYNCSSEYENIKYGAEYENVHFRPDYPGLDFELTDESVRVEERHIGSVDRETDEKLVCADRSPRDICYENVNVAEGETMSVDENYENVATSVKESLPVYENLDESDDQEHIVPEVDDAYEEYSFTEQPEYENVEFKSQASAVLDGAPKTDKSEVEIEGEMVYQQVKFLRQSIQEVNELLKVNGEKQRNHKKSQNDSVSESSLTEPLDTAVDTVNLIDNSSELPVQVPQMGDTSVPKPCESMPCSQNTVSQPVEIAIDNDISIQPNEDSECLDSPVTPSSTSLATEVLVLPAFASPTESTTDDVTSPVSSDDGSSPKPVQDPHGQCLSPSTVPPILPSLSPPTPECVPVPPAATSTPNRTLTSIITPAPWPRTTSRHTSITAPVPRPRQLPKLNLSSPLVSPVSTPSSVSISPDSPATPGTPSAASGHDTPTEENPNFKVFQPSHLPVVISNQKVDSVESKVSHGMDASSTTTSAKEYMSTGRSLGTHIPPESVNQDLNISLEKKTSPAASSLQRFKTSPDFRLSSKVTGVQGTSQENTSKEAEDASAIAVVTFCSNPADPDDQMKRERIEKYKEERRSFLREKYKSDSFRGEKDEMLLRLKQKATSPSRPEDEDEDEDEDPHQSSNIRPASPRRKGSISPTKNLYAFEGRTSPNKPPSTEKQSMDYTVNTEKNDVDDDDQGNVFKQTSPVRRNLSDMDHPSDIKSPARPRLSSGSPSTTFQRSSSCSSNSNNSKTTGVTSPRSSLRKTSEKDIILKRSSSSETKSNLCRKISSPTSPVKSPTESSPFQRSASIGSRRKVISNVEDDVNVKERVAIWSAAKSQDNIQSKDIVNKTSKSEKIGIKKQEQKTGKEHLTRKNSVPLSPTRKSSVTKVTSSSPNLPKTTPLSPGLPKATQFPSALPKAPSVTVSKNSIKSSTIGEGSVDVNAAGGNIAVRGNSGQQRRIRDMAAIFERDSPTSGKPALLRQSSREEKKER